MHKKSFYCDDLFRVNVERRFRGREAHTSGIVSEANLYQVYDNVSHLRFFFLQPHDTQFGLKNKAVFFLPKLGEGSFEAAQVLQVKLVNNYHVKAKG